MNATHGAKSALPLAYVVKIGVANCKRNIFIKSEIARKSVRILIGADISATRLVALVTPK